MYQYEIEKTNKNETDDDDEDDDFHGIQFVYIKRHLVINIEIITI